MTSAALRRWLWVHKWSSLVCTVFLLVLCVTGLPLLFEDQIAAALDPPTHYAVVPAHAPRADLDRLVATSREMYPRQIVTGVAIDDDEPQVTVTMAPSWAVARAHPEFRHWIKFDAHTGQVLGQSQPPGGKGYRAILNAMLALHRSLFEGLAGGLFVGLMALLFVAAIISGLILYGPFARKLPFGTVRSDRTPRLKWLDRHNLIGIVTVAWALVVGLTGVMNELESPLFSLWEITEVRQVLAPWRGKPIPPQSQLSSVQAAVDTTLRALPGHIVTSIGFPGTPGASPLHYLLWTKGDRPLTGRLFTPVLVDARTGALAVVAKLPWYLRTLELSRPLHFGDYGGLPLKVLWALLDLATITVLGSGLYLWLSHRKAPIQARIDELALTEAALDRAASDSAMR